MCLQPEWRIRILCKRDSGEILPFWSCYDRLDSGCLEAAGTGPLPAMRTKRLLALLFVLTSLSGCSKKTVTTQDELDRRFEEMMKGVTLVGRSTRDNNDKFIGEDKYVIRRHFESSRRHLGAARAHPMLRPRKRSCAGTGDHQMGRRHTGHHADGSFHSGYGNLYRPGSPLPRAIRGHVERQKPRRPDLREDCAKSVELLSGAAGRAQTLAPLARKR